MSDLKNVCLVDGCQADRYRKGYCNKHNIQIRRHGRITDIVFEQIEGEKWEPIKGFEGKYEVSSFGRVKSIQFGGQKILKPHLSRGGYRVRLGAVAPSSVAHLVADAFVSGQPASRRLLYWDGDKTNCAANNIHWYSRYSYQQGSKTLKEQERIGRDARLVTQYMAGDNEAFERLVEPYLGKVFWHIKKKLFYYEKGIGIKITVEAQDILQETCIKAMAGIKAGLLIDATKVLAWLKTIARNTLIDESKKQPYSQSTIQTTRDGEEFEISGTAF
jgi:NUMOD4 motif/Sigma-70 region 2